MIVFFAVASILVFVTVLWLLRIVPLASKAVSISRGSLETLRNDALSDLEREKAMQEASISLLRLFLSILVRGSLALLASVLPIILGDLTGLVDGQGVIEFLSRIDVILIISAVMLALYLVARHARPTK